MSACLFNPKPNGLGVSRDAQAAGPAVKRGHDKPAAAYKWEMEAFYDAIAKVASTVVG
jgi:hypothetical protein